MRILIGNGFILRDVLHIPGAWNLFSELYYLNLLTQSHFGWYVKRHLKNAVYTNDITKEEGPRAVYDDKHRAQFMLFRPQQSGIVMALLPLPGTNTSMYWHERLGHMSMRKIRDSVRCGALQGVPMEQLTKDINCLVCAKAHMTRTPFKRLPLRNDYKPGERWHIDIAHGGKVEGRDGSSSILVCKDDATGYKILYFLSSKTQAIDCVKSLVEWVYTQKNVKVKALMTDQGTENVNKDIKLLCDTRGIEHHLSAPDHPQSNGVVERENRTNQEGIQALLQSANLPPSFWIYAADFHAHIHNLLICRRSKNKSPYEAFWGKKPREVSYLIPFGSNVIYYDDKATDKLDTRGKEGTFLGYARHTTKIALVLTEDKSVKQTKHIKLV